MTGKHSKYTYVHLHTQFPRQSLDGLDLNDISVKKVYFMPSCQSLFIFPLHPIQVHRFMRMEMKINKNISIHEFYILELMWKTQKFWG